MADITAEAALTVDVQNEAAIQRLATALADLQRQAGQVQGAVNAGGAAAAANSAAAGVVDLGKKAQQEASTLGTRITQKFAEAAKSAWRAPFDVLRASSQVVGRSLMGLTGSLGTVASSAGTTSIAIVGVGAALTGLLVPFVNLVAGLKVLQLSFGWAQQAAENQITVAGRTRRFFPELIGEGLDAAEDTMKARMGVAAAMFGTAADSMQESITRRMTAFRLGRGIRGERDIYARWGITPENVQQYERQAGRIDLTKWLRLFIIQREQLEADLSKAQTPTEKALIRQKLIMLSDDTVKIFGQKFSDMVGAMTDTDMVRLQNNMKAAIPLGHVENATRRMIDFTIALESIKATFRALFEGIGGDVQPSITRFLDVLNERLIDTEKGGYGVGRALRELASTLANKAWEALRDIMEEIDPETVNEWIDAIRQWNPADTAVSVKSLIEAVWNFGVAVKNLLDKIEAGLQMLPNWMTGRKPPWAMEDRWAGPEAFRGGGGGGGLGGDMGGLGDTGPAPGPEAPGPTQAAPGAPDVFGGGVAPAQPTTPEPTGPSTFNERFGAWGTGSTAAPGTPPPPVQAPAAPGPPPPPPEPPAAAGAALGGAAPAPVTAATGPSTQATTFGDITGRNIAGEFGLSNMPAPGAPPPPPQGPAATGEPSVAEPDNRSTLRRLWDRFRGRDQAAGQTPPAAPASEVTAQSAAMDALKGSATGRAAAMMTDVQRGPEGDSLVMKTSMQSSGVGPSATRWGLYGAGMAASATGIAPGAGAIGAAMGRAGTMEEGNLSDVARGMIPGMGTLEMIKRDSETGNTTRTYLRQMLGINDPGEHYDWRTGQQDTAMTDNTPGGTFTDRFGNWQTSGGITVQDGANFGAAAGEQFKEQLAGVALGGYAATSAAVAPRTAPKPTGGDTASEA